MVTTSRAPRTSTKRAPLRGGPTVDLLTLTVRAVVAAVIVAVLGLAITLILTVSAWLVAPHDGGTDAQTALRVAASGWLLCQHVAIELPSGTLGLVPLGLMLIPGALIYLGGRQLAQAFRMQTPADVLGGAIPYALAYGIVVAVVAGLTASGSSHPHAWQGFVAGTVMATACGTFGMLRGARLLDTVWHRMGFELRQVLAAATAGLAVMIGFAALLTTVGLAIGFPDGVNMTQALAPDLLGGVLLAVLGMAFVPNLIIWTAAFTTGAGFSLGTGSAVSPQGIHYDALPVFPPLAALPPEGHPGAWGVAALVAPLLAGVMTGFLIHRRLPGRPANVVAGLAIMAGSAVGVGLGLLAWLSSGGVADGRLSVVGPQGWRVGLVGGLEVALVAAAVAWESRRRAWTGQSLQQAMSWLGDRARSLAGQIPRPRRSAPRDGA